MDELIKALREQCEDCSEIGVNAKGCSPMFYCPILDAADALEELQAENAMLKTMQPVNLSGEAAKSFGLALELSKTKAQLAQVTADLEKAKQPEKPEEIAKSAKGGWISVKDRLPEESGYCLTYTDYSRVNIYPYSTLHKLFNAFDDICGDKYAIREVTHWMPLPNPPEPAP